MLGLYTYITVQLLFPGPIFRTFFEGENFGENSAEIFPLENVREICDFLRKKFQKIVSPKKFRGKSLSAEKNVQKIGPRSQSFDLCWYNYKAVRCIRLHTAFLKEDKEIFFV
jgi:hypothetical protein